MLGWIAENMGTILVTVILAAVLCAVLVKLIRDKRKGKSSCGCGCSSCAGRDLCHKR